MQPVLKELVRTFAKLLKSLAVNRRVLQDVCLEASFLTIILALFHFVTSDFFFVFNSIRMFKFLVNDG